MLWFRPLFIYLFVYFLRNSERRKGEDEALLFFSFGFKNGEVSQGTGNNFCSLFRFVRITFRDKVFAFPSASSSF